LAGVDGLLEREAELERLGVLMGAARERRGSALLIEGAAGLGKSALLDAGGRAAHESGFQVLRARGGELEHAFAWGLVRQLLEREVTEAGEHRRATLFSGAAAHATPIVGAAAPADEAGAAPVDALALEHGLYWLLSNLAEERPLALLVDDLHWGDVPTLRFLVYLTRRLEGMPIAVVGAVRLGEPGASGALMDALRSESLVESTELEPLGHASVEGLVNGELGREAEPEFVRACHEVSGGNPFLLSELLRTLADEGAEPTDASAARVREVGPVGVSRSVLLRLARLPAKVTALAQAVAVLGVGAELREAAALADLGDADADQAADALTEARILAPERPLQFMHPLVRNAIYTDLPAARRAADHKRAAKLLAAADAAPERVAGQLLLSEPGGDEWVAATLRAAGQNALARGAPEAAVEYLDRALTEPPPADERAGVVRALGTGRFLAGGRTGPAAGAELLREGLDETEEPHEWAAGALELAVMLIILQRASEAVSVLERAIAQLPADDPLASRVEAFLAGAAQSDISTASLLDGRLADAERLRGESPEERLLLATLAYRCANRGDSASAAVALAERAVAGGRLFAEQPVDAIELIYAVMPLILAERFETAGMAIEHFFARARSRGAWNSFSQASWLRACLNHRRGALGEAVTDARNARSAHEIVGVPVTLGLLLDILVDRGELDVAQAELESADIDEALISATTLEPLFFLAGRGRLRIAQGELDAGLTDLLELGRRCERWGDANPAQFSWRSDAALALVRLGDRDEAQRLAEDELERARRFGATRAIAIALRALGIAEGGTAGIDRLLEAVSVLEGSPALLTRAQVLVELGAALRRANRRTAAREALSEGHEVAERCEAGALLERARDELGAAGSRPRSVIRTGAAALTPSERRVCRLAADGLSNPEIAQALFVTRSTVESHLHSAYGKLEIASRRELARALEPAGAAPDA
jgi:DNA-binding CsgD family transcriptional regulator